MTEVAKCRPTEKENSNWKTLFYKDCSLGSFKTKQLVLAKRLMRRDRQTETARQTEGERERVCEKEERKTEKDIDRQSGERKSVREGEEKWGGGGGGGDLYCLCRPAALRLQRERERDRGQVR